MKKQNTRFYGSTSVAKTLGLSLRQLYHWVDTLRVVHPQLWRHGRRRFRRFSSSDIKKLREIKKHLERGYTLKAATEIVKRLRG